jgi:hypothetical protein
MSRFEKLLNNMRQNPSADWTIDNLMVIAKRLGIEVRNSNGSHHVFSFSRIGQDLTVPFRRPIKPIYIKKFIVLVDAVMEVL